MCGEVEVGTHCRSAISCTVAATVIGSVFNDVVYSTGSKFGVDVLELREIFTESIDYANPIEPSHIGGGKLAERILEWIKSYE